MAVKPEWKREERLITGLWKFSPNVTLEELQEFALNINDLGRETPGFGHAKRYIRGSGKKGALCLGFEYHLCGSRTQEGFFEKYTDILKRRFGNDFVGWDMSHPTWVLVGIVP